MRRYLTIPLALCAVGLFALHALAKDIGLWWAWRKEDNPRGGARGKAAGAKPMRTNAVGVDGSY